MIFGIAYLGKIKKIGSTCIETKFVVIGIPLFPVGSIIVSEKRNHVRLGIDIPLNGASVFAAYARMITFWAGGIAFLFGAGNPDRGLNNGNLIIQLTGIGLLLLWAVVYFQFGKASHKEIEQWTIIKESPGIRALPGWLSFTERIRSLKALEFLYTLQYKIDGQSALNKEDISLEQLVLLYKIALFRVGIDASLANQQLLDKIASRITTQQKQAIADNENKETAKTTIFGSN